MGRDTVAFDSTEANCQMVCDGPCLTKRKQQNKGHRATGVGAKRQTPEPVPPVGLHFLFEFLSALHDPRNNSVLRKVAESYVRVEGYKVRHWESENGHSVDRKPSTFTGRDVLQFIFGGVQEQIRELSLPIR